MTKQPAHTQETIGPFKRAFFALSAAMFFVALIRLVGMIADPCLAAHRFELVLGALATLGVLYLAMSFAVRGDPGVVQPEA